MSPVPGGRGGEGAGITLCLQGTEEGRLEIKDLHAGEDIWEASAHVCWHFARPPSLKQGEGVEHRRGWTRVCQGCGSDGGCCCLSSMS